MNNKPGAFIASLITVFRIFAKGFAEMHGNARIQMNKNKGLGLAWQMQPIYFKKLIKKEETKMKDTTYTKKLAYIGAGCGVALFAIFGLLPGSFLGGVMGLNIAGVLLGTPVGAGLLPRMIVAASMVVGVMVSGLMFITASATLGWLAGTVVDAIKTERKEPATAEHK